MKKFLVGVFVLMFIGAGCGLVEKTTTVTKTVTATPSPSSSPTIVEPYFSETDLAGIDSIEGFLADLKHINSTIAATLEYGGRTGNLTGVEKRVSHYADDWQELQEEYIASNGGEMYGGRVKRLEHLFENASGHVQKFGIWLMRIVTNGTDRAITNCAIQQVKAEDGIEAVEDELVRLKSSIDTPSY